jgi:hypothetical protein
MTPAAILQWIEQHARTVIVQELPPTRRRKNRVMLEYRAPGGDKKAVGSYSVAGAVERAAGRIAAIGERKAS